MAVVVVENGESLRANNLVEYVTLRDIKVNLYVNTDHPLYGASLYRDFQPQAQIVRELDPHALLAFQVPPQKKTQEEEKRKKKKK